jgi:hypothetical protein
MFYKSIDFEGRRKSYSKQKQKKTNLSITARNHTITSFPFNKNRTATSRSFTTHAPMLLTIIVPLEC